MASPFNNCTHLIEQNAFSVEHISLERQKSIKQDVYFVNLNAITGVLQFSKNKNTVQNVKPAFTIDLLEIQQVRTAEKCTEAMKYLEQKNKNFNLTFAVVYGKKFNLNCVLLKVFNNQELYNKWITELPAAVKFYQNDTYSNLLDRFLNREYSNLNININNRDSSMRIEVSSSLSLRLNTQSSGSAVPQMRVGDPAGTKAETKLLSFIQRLESNVESIQVWLKRHNYYFKSTQKLTEKLQAHHPLTFENFKQFYEANTLEEEACLIRKMSEMYFKKDGKTYYIDKVNLEKWLIERQSMKKDEAKFEAENVIKMYSKNGKYLTQRLFLLYLLSKDNSIFDVKKQNSVYQDMSQPLCHYWIESSHNSYLTGYQQLSMSSCEAYIRILQTGCRCIEIDVWDDGDRICVTHGHALCAKIDLKDVLHAVHAYAFDYSDYPLIISIENHVDVKNQKRMADMFLEIFGDMLVTAFVNENEKCLPSPTQLKRRVILKNAKLKQQDTSNRVNDDSFESILSSEDDDVMMSDGVELEVINEYDVAVRRFTFEIDIEAMRLYYYELRQTDDDTLSLDDDSGGDVIRNGFYPSVTNTDPNENEPWFVHNIDRVKSIKILETYRECFRTGTFIVRKSESQRDSCTLCLLHVNPTTNTPCVYFIKINIEIIKKRRRYILNESFETLKDLVQHYREKEINTTASISMKLGTGVSRDTISVNEPWFKPSLESGQDKHLLNQAKYNGSFLIRSSTSMTRNDDGQTHHYTLSFYYDGNVYFSKIYTENENYTIKYFINNIEFKSLVQLVNYYKRIPAYKTQKLTKPVDEVLLERFNNPVEASEPARTPLVHHKSTSDSVNTTADSNFDTLSYETTYESDYFDLKLTEIKYSIDAKNKRYEFKITSKTAPVRTICGNGALDPTKEKLLQRLKALQDQLNPTLPSQTKKARSLAVEFSNLICYCQAVRFNPENPIGAYYEISSFSEQPKRIFEPSKMKPFIKRHSIQLSRVYPKGHRIDSSNYNPYPLWSLGFQLVALNYQTGDKAMQMNHAKFEDNGRCGYVLKPKYMLNENYNPIVHDRRINDNIYEIDVSVISGHHLPKNRVNDVTNVSSPLVEIECIVNTEFEGIVQGKEKPKLKIRTDRIKSNGLFPLWHTQTKLKEAFEVSNIHCAFLRFSVYESDLIGSDVLLAQATIPVSCLRKGLRSVPLKNVYSEDFDLSSLLVNVNIYEISGNNEEANIFDDFYVHRQNFLELKQDLEIKSVNNNSEEDLISVKRRMLQAEANLEEADKRKSAVMLKRQSEYESLYYNLNEF